MMLVVVAIVNIVVVGFVAVSCETKMPRLSYVFGVVDCVKYCRVNNCADRVDGRDGL